MLFAEKAHAIETEALLLGDEEAKLKSVFKMQNNRMTVSSYNTKLFYIFVVVVFAFSVIAALLFISLDSTIFKQTKQCSEIQWDYDKPLAPNDKFRLKWTTRDDAITMMVIAKTSGWFGLGFRPNDKMEGADLVIGWVKDGNVYLQDHLIVDEFHSSLDHHQDYEIIDGKEDGIYTTMCFRRKLDTCDNDDIKILQGSLPITWALGRTDPKNPSTDLVKLNESETGTTRIDFLALKYTDIPEDSDVIRIRMNNVSLPNDKENLYWCQMFKLPKFKQQPYYIGMKPILNPASKDVIHHIGVFLCLGEVTEDLKTKGMKGGQCISEYSDIQWSKCMKSFVIWTVNNDELELYPSHVGYPFGSAQEPTYVMLNNHYYNPQKIPGIIDNSGMEIYYTTKPPLYEASTLLIGYVTNEKLMIPPMLENFKVHAICDPACINATFPQDGIHVYGVRHHAHMTGKKVRIRIFRDGKELKPIGDEYFNYKYEHTVYLKEELTIYSTDHLMIECEFNSMMKNYTTFGGAVTTDEMCEVYLYYYPPVKDMNSCWSGNNKTEILSIFGKTGDLINGHFINPELQNHTVHNYFRHYQFSDSEIESLRNIYSNSKHSSMCVSGKSSIFMKRNEVEEPQGIPYEEKNLC